MRAISKCTNFGDSYKRTTTDLLDTDNNYTTHNNSILSASLRVIFRVKSLRSFSLCQSATHPLPHSTPTPPHPTPPPHLTVSSHVTDLAVGVNKSNSQTLNLISSRTEISLQLKYTYKRERQTDIIYKCSSPCHGPDYGLYALVFPLDSF